MFRLESNGRSALALEDRRIFEWQRRGVARGRAAPVDLVYHDHEWGVPLHDDRRLFEMLILEGAQAGLSWITILRKRDAYQKAFDGFDPRKVARYRPDRIERFPVRRPLPENRDPAQPRLRALEGEHLEQPPIVVEGHAPLLVVVAGRRAGRYPPTSNWLSSSSSIRKILLSSNASADRPLLSSRNTCAASRATVGLR